MWGLGGTAQLDALDLPTGYATRLESLRDLIAVYDREVGIIDGIVRDRLKNDAGYTVIQDIDGIGPVIAATFVAEIGDIGRFESPRRLSSWAGLTPRHRESDEKVKRGHITKQGSTLVRWAAIEAVSKFRGGEKLRADYHRISQSAGKFKARVAVARKLLTLVYYGLRDGEIRCLEAARAA